MLVTGDSLTWDVDSWLHNYEVRYATIYIGSYCRDLGSLHWDCRSRFNYLGDFLHVLPVVELCPIESATATATSLQL